MIQHYILSKCSSILYVFVIYSRFAAVLDENMQIESVCTFLVENTCFSIKTKFEAYFSD
jgi:hypothetical protein